MSPRAGWRRSSYSDNGANCVEVAFVGGAVVARDSKDPAGPVLAFPRARWGAFLASLGDRSGGR
ncbi:DUF397 domain-containing protein [Saccharopolyspora cebuensis]|uniref:DUF397 domain-containing protein n=1 Tax=Saccharopolyspora cebuensis TaxID=418759 RepID=A0ABV4CI97_9PSEU